MSFLRAFAFLCVALSGAVAEANWGWLRGAAVTGFEESDWEHLRSAAAEAFENVPAGETYVWKNDATGNGGSITVVRVFEMGGNACRRARFRQEARNGTVGEAAYNACRYEDGWKLISDTETRKALESSP